MRNRRSTVAGLGTIFAGGALVLALGAPAEAGGHGNRGSRGHHVASRSHGHASVGYYRGGGRYYRPVVHRSTTHRSYGVYGTRGSSHRSYRTYPYTPVYRPYRSSPSFEQGYRNHLPYPVYLPAPAFGSPAYVEARPIYVEAPAPAAQPQTIYIVVQPAAGVIPPNPPGGAAPGTAPAAAPADEPEPIAASPGEPGLVHLRVEPADAAVYLDDELLGSGGEIAGVGEPMPLSSGVHVIEVLHPDYPPQRLVFGVPSAGELKVEIDLDGDVRGRRLQVKDLDHGLVEPGG